MVAVAGSLPSPASRPSILILRGRTPARRCLSSMVDVLANVFASGLDEGRIVVSAALRVFRVLKSRSVVRKSSIWRDVGRLSLATLKL